MTAAGLDRPDRRRSAPGGRFLERVRIDGQRMDADVSGRVLAAKLIRAVDAATSVVLTLDDWDLQLLRSSALTVRGKARPRKEFQEAAWARFGDARLTLDGIVYRLAGVSGTYNATTRQVTLTFEDEVAALLRRYKGRYKKIRKGSLTRARFIAALTHEVRERRINTDIPEIGAEQPIRSSSPRARARQRRKGIDRSAGLTAKGATMVRSQIRTAERVLAVCDEEQAGDRASMALLTACIVEPLPRPFDNPTFGDADSVGILQLRSMHLGGSASTDGGRRDIELVCELFLTRGFYGRGGAIDIAAEHPDWSIGQIAQEVQGSGHPERYDLWAKEAEEILAAYGGSGRITLDTKEYEFQRGKDEDSWECTDRLAREVNVRYMADFNVLHYVSDDYLIGLQPVFTLHPDDPAVVSWQLDEDVGIAKGEITVQVIKPRNTGRPGIPIAVKGMGPFNGRWHTGRIEDDLFELTPMKIVLYRPSPQLPEPAPERERVQRSEGTPESGSARDRILEAALWALRRTEEYSYSMSGAALPALGHRPTAGFRIDCSWFVTLVYKRAGQPDPNGGDYRAGGNTSTLRANGTKTNDPQIGDQVHFGSGSPGGQSHVGIYVGDGEMIDMSGSRGISRRAIWKTGTPTFAGYWTSELD